MKFTRSVITDSPVTKQEAKANLNIDSSDFDSQIDSWRLAATSKLQDYLQRSFLTQTITGRADKFPTGHILLPYGPIRSVTSISYVKSDGTTATLTEGTDYRVDIYSTLGRIEAIDSWPATKDQVNAVTVVYEAGYGAASAVPTEIKDAIKGMITVFDQNRGDGNINFDWAMDVASFYKVYESAW